MSPVDSNATIILAAQLAQVALELLSRIKQQEGLTNDQLFDRGAVTNAATRRQIAAYLDSLEG